MTGIINYGAGNIRSVCSSVIACGERVFLIEEGNHFKKANIIILPGVGAFDDGTKVLSLKGIIKPLIEEINNGKPFLGICLGLQMLFSYSEEGDCEGLGIMKGEVKKFTIKNNEIRVPHMAWNRVKLLDIEDPLFFNIGDNQYFYFAHSYYVEPDDSSVVAGRTNYGIEFASFIKKDNIVGVQFHPEKSGDNGIKFLKNFLEGKWQR
ncbi:MAG: imidazole glycerol phosphate synthase subunit HisH [Candidatus Omnitrophica bacterium]|nr:imidazole glycerol phosphate synthase subunit HisH [Candidatus Omnitrophota bacterium]MCM8777696.1 imidazole glycerol phosphate synthase subunit HisH [Candidatus Omnitrophota bacterium]